MSPWWDCLLPLAMVMLALQEDSDPPTVVAVLLSWLAVRLLSRCWGQPLAWVLGGCLLISQASLAMPPSDSVVTDLLIVLLAFLAGTERSREHWHVSLPLLVCTLIPACFAVRWDRPNMHLSRVQWPPLRALIPPESLRLEGIAINDSAFILVLLTLLAWIWFRFAAFGVQRWLALGFVAGGYLLCLATGSRLGLLFPPAVALMMELVLWLRVRRRLGARPLAGLLALTAGGLVLAIYRPFLPLSALSDSDQGRVLVGRCFVDQALTSTQQLLTGLAGDSAIETCGLATQSPVFPHGVSHAHNQLLQVLTDYGLLAAVFGVVLFGVTLVRSLELLGSADTLPALISLMVVLALVPMSLVESSLLQISFKQLLCGYLLAATWRPCSGSVGSQGRSISRPS